jgi:YD repeat-containing protein
MAIHHRGGTIRRARFGGDCCPADWIKPRRRFLVADRLNQTTTFVYDHLHRQTSVTNPNGEVTAYAYDALGQRTGLTDPEGNTTTWVYDGLNRVGSKKGSELFY